MKKMLFMIILLWSSISYSQPKMEFETTLFNFGEIQGDVDLIEGEFNFTNKGTEPLIIYQVQSSGGILFIKNYPKDTIYANESGKISFACSIEPNILKTSFTKSISINSNATPSFHVLIAKGEIMPRKSNSSF